MGGWLARVRGRLGAFWWSAALLFLAYRFGDAVNAVVNLWLVPKFVGEAELGAVLPLSNFANFLLFPVSVFAVALARQVADLGAKGERGRMKTLLAGAFLGSGALLLAALAVSVFALPPFLARLRVVGGSLGIVIVFSAFAAALAPVFTAALQALGRFGALSLLQAATAPLRFVTMAAAMPARPLPGYFAGQSAPPLAAIGTALWALRRELAVRAEPFWREYGRSFLKFALTLGAVYAVGSFSGTLQSTALRTGVPSVDSAAYFLITRFAEIATYVGGSVAIVLFPVAARAAARGEDATAALVKANRATVLSGLAAAAALFVFGESAFLAIPTCAPYAAYYPEMALAALSMTFGMAVCNFANFEVAQNRFGYFLWEGPLSLASAAVMTFAGFSALRAFLLVMLAQNLIGYAVVAAIVFHRVGAGKTENPR